MSQLAFPGGGNPNFPWDKSHWDNTVVKKFKKKKVSRKIGRRKVKTKKTEKRERKREKEGKKGEGVEVETYRVGWVDGGGGGGMGELEIIRF